MSMDLVLETANLLSVAFCWQPKPNLCVLNRKNLTRGLPDCQLPRCKCRQVFSQDEPRGSPAKDACCCTASECNQLHCLYSPIPPINTPGCTRRSALSHNSRTYSLTMNSHSSPATKILNFFQSAFKISKFQRFSLFPKLPLEIRLEIWRLSLPEGPRVLQAIRKLPSSTSHDPHGTLGQAPYKVRPVSYGGHQIPILSVNRESRAEALQYLTLIWGTYWNLELDAPYFEIRNNWDDCVTLIPELRKKGELDRFKNITIDWMLWDWNGGRPVRPHQLRDRFAEYEHP
jgi:hypothetical protein